MTLPPLDPADLRAYSARDWGAPDRLSRRARALLPVAEKVRIAVALYAAIFIPIPRVGRGIVLRHDTTGFEVDLVIAGSGLETLALSRATLLPLAGVDVPVAHATDLAGRACFRRWSLRFARSIGAD